MSTLLPTAEHMLDVGVRRAVEALRGGATVETATRVLMVATYAAALVQADAPALDHE